MPQMYYDKDADMGALKGKTIGYGRLGSADYDEGATYLARGVVTWQQAGFGILLAAFITVAYLVFYPRAARIVAVTGSPTTGPSPLP